MSTQTEPANRIDELLQHSDWVRSLAYRLVLDASRADDLVQDTWVVALERPPGHAGNLRAWLGRVVTSLARSTWRSESRRDRREEATARHEALPSTEDLVQEASMTRELAGAVLELGEPFRTVLLLRYFRDLTPTQIAKELDRPVATVKTQLQRGMAKLRDRFDDDYDGARDAWTSALLPLALAGAPTVGGTISALVPAAAAAGLLAVGAVAIQALSDPGFPPREVFAVEALEPPPFRSQEPGADDVTGPEVGETVDGASDEGRVALAGSTGTGRSGIGGATNVLGGLLLNERLQGLEGFRLDWRDPGALQWANDERTVISGARIWLPVAPELLMELERSPMALERFASENFPRPEVAIAFLRGEEAPNYSTTTRVGGEFEMHVPEPGLEIELDDDAWGILGTASLELEAERRAWIASTRRTYIGTVVDPDGEFVPDLRVVASSSAPASVRTVMTEGTEFLPLRHEDVSDPMGEVTFDGPIALTPRFLVQVLREDEWLEIPIDLSEQTLGEEVRFTIELPPLQQPLITLTGRVLLSSGAPAPRSIVVFNDAWSATDENGNYELELFSLEGDLQAGRAGSGVVVLPQAGLAYAGLEGEQPAPDLRLPDHHLSIRGFVTDGKGSPVVRARVSLVGGKPIPEKIFSLEDVAGARTLGYIETDDEGGFELTGLLPSDYQVHITDGIHESISGSVAAGILGREFVLENRD